MDRTFSLTDRVNAIKHNCSPLGVKVNLVRRKDRYYVKLSCDALKSEPWIKQWGGFHAFSKFQINPQFPEASLTSANESSATYFIGTLFDFLQN